MSGWSLQEIAVPEALLAPVEPPPERHDRQDGPQDQQDGPPERRREADLAGDLDTVISQLERLQHRVSGLRQVAQLRQQRSQQVRQSDSSAASR